VRRADLVVAGRYARARAAEAGPWSGAGGKELWPVSGRIGPEESPGCRVEAQIRPDGAWLVTGFPEAEFFAGGTAPPRGAGEAT
ncbi:MAG: hypothetical protein HY553_20825, partial [Elusimicrobia bacterium]|nr:hypothetical protein [Elusimicrobiota bacterium]